MGEKQWQKSGLKFERDDTSTWDEECKWTINRPLVRRLPTVYHQATPVLLVYVACISGASSSRTQTSAAIPVPVGIPEDLGLVLPPVPFYAALDGIKEDPFPLNRSPRLRACRRILLEFSSSRKVNNSWTAPVRGKPRIRLTIYYIINFKYVIRAVYDCMKNIRMWARLRGDFRREIRRASAAFLFRPGRLLAGRNDVHCTDIYCEREWQNHYQRYPSNNGERMISHSSIILPRSALT